MLIEKQKNTLNTQKYYKIKEKKKKNTEQKITLMKKNALKEIKNISIKITMETVESLINNSIDKKKLEKFYSKSLEQTRTALKHTKA